MKRGHTTNAWHKNYEGKSPTGTWSSQDRAYKLNLCPPARPWQGQGADGSSTWEAQGVPNMMGENGKAKLNPIAMHKPPQETFARYREPSPGVVGYISMDTGLTNRKIITPGTSAGDRPTTIGESLRDYLTSVGAADAPHLRGSRTSKHKGANTARGSRTSEAPRYRWCPRLPHDQGTRLPMVFEAPAHPSTKVLMVPEALTRSRPRLPMVPEDPTRPGA
ncbi:hypothetical protein GOBAR_AA13369 [Gossypium barbadense]|uniref:Uncharacterized protein n=1 Tax=Gossypium barbadense TaxID=3634 RepID=A0A2P5XV84_GOSBA|nr:hypothetical protein GOBAR_AA13369 [Gossypium barbadense]